MNKKHYFCKYTKFICNRLMVASYILFFLSANVTNAYATSNPTEVTKSGDIIIKVANKPIKEVLTLIEQQSKFVFVYNTESVNLDKPVTLNITSGSINEIMTQLLKGSSLSYEISDRQILIFRSNQKDSKTSAKMLSRERFSTKMVKPDWCECASKR
ncbi:STN domain-containing protein [Bacteroides graminisolvens]|uniref:STN domain-containing protein n=1 Tax=Bacteroides graminisolvens TaxID=477666 RepID=UPI000691180B|nr:STN domain-containing protein [Bacteroides graminisolvens]